MAEKLIPQDKTVMLAQEFEQSVNMIYRHNMGLVGNHHTAEDITSEAFLTAHGKIDAYDSSKSSLKTWIFTIDRNKAFDYLRSLARHPVLSLGEGEVSPVNQIEDLPDFAEIENLKKALENLPEQQRTVIIKKYIFETTFKDIAQQEGIPLGTAKRRHHLAIAKLRKVLISR